MARGAGDKTITDAVRCPSRSTEKIRHPEELQAEATKGLPRPLVSYEKKWLAYKEFDRDRLVVPWLNWSEIKENKNWVGFDPKALKALHENDYLLCGVCGEQLGENKIYGQLYGQANITSGSGMHPACALLAWKYCPDLNRHQGFSLYSGEGHGLKLGEGAATLHEGMYDVSEVFLDDEAREIDIDEIRTLAKIDGKRQSSGKCPINHQQ